MHDDAPTPSTGIGRPRRRDVLKLGAWSMPVIATSMAAPLAAATTDPPQPPSWVRAVVGGDSYAGNVFSISTQVPVQSPFQLVCTASGSAEVPQDFSVNGEAESRWASTRTTTTYVLPTDAGYRLRNIVVTLPWAANSPYTQPYLQTALAAQWNNDAKRWLNSDPRLPMLERPQEGHPEYATLLADAGPAWDSDLQTIPTSGFDLVRPYLGTNDFTFTRPIDNVTTVSHVSTFDSVPTFTIPLAELNPGDSFSISYRVLREVAFKNGNRFHGYVIPEIVIADYAPLS